MKYLELFENFEDNEIKTIFEDLINWKIFNYLKECATEYEDMGYLFTIDLFIDYDGKKLFIYRTFVNEDFSSVYEEWANQDYDFDIEVYQDAFYENGISYDISLISTVIDDNNLKQYIISILEKIKRKLKIEESYLDFDYDNNFVSSVDCVIKII